MEESSYCAVWHLCGHHTLNMNQRKQKQKLSEEIKMKNVHKHGKGKGYKIKQLDVRLTTVSNIMKFKVK